jgi:hypothetical protein
MTALPIFGHHSRVFCLSELNIGLIIAISVCNGLFLSVENKLALAASSTTIDATVSDNEDKVVFMESFTEEGE